MPGVRFSSAYYYTATYLNDLALAQHTRMALSTICTASIQSLETTGWLRILLQGLSTFWIKICPMVILIYLMLVLQMKETKTTMMKKRNSYRYHQKRQTSFFKLLLSVDCFIPTPNLLMCVIVITYFLHYFWEHRIIFCFIFKSNSFQISFKMGVECNRTESHFRNVNT